MAMKAYLGKRFKGFQVANYADFVRARGTVEIVYNAEELEAMGIASGSNINVRCGRADTNYSEDKPQIKVYFDVGDGNFDDCYELSDDNGWDIVEAYGSPYMLNSNMKLVFTNSNADTATTCNFYNVEIIDMNTEVPRMVRVGYSKNGEAKMAKLSL